MKLLKYIIRAGVVCGLLLTAATTRAQGVQLKVMAWNVLSFEMTDKSNQVDFIVDQFVDFIKAQNPDVVCINELETATSRMGKDKLIELAARLNMYCYYIMSYPKDVGYYGNGILSKYPILNSYSVLFEYQNYKGPGNYQWNSGWQLNAYGADQRSIGYADILVPTSKPEGQLVRVVCTHFDHMGDYSVRVNQAKAAVQHIGLTKPEYPTLMLGDLNLSAGTAIDVLTEVGDHVGVSWVDHILSFPKGRWTSHDFKAVNCGKLSDHDPVMATVVLK